MAANEATGLAPVAARTSPRTVTLSRPSAESSPVPLSMTQGTPPPLMPRIGLVAPVNAVGTADHRLELEDVASLRGNECRLRGNQQADQCRPGSRGRWIAGFAWMKSSSRVWSPGNGARPGDLLRRTTATPTWFPEEAPRASGSVAIRHLAVNRPVPMGHAPRDLLHSSSDTRVVQDHGDVQWVGRSRERDRERALSVADGTWLEAPFHRALQAPAHRGKRAGHDERGHHDRRPTVHRSSSGTSAGRRPRRRRTGRPGCPPGARTRACG